jgi:hypothetical protein
VFFIRCFKDRCFNETRCSWISQILYNGTVAVKLNETIGSYFQSHKGVRQGNPLSPILFNMVVDCLTRMVMKAQQSALVTELIPHLIDSGIAILQYADDTVMCLQDDIGKAWNVKLLLYIYEQLSDLKINFNKSEIILVGVIID